MNQSFSCQPTQSHSNAGYELCLQPTLQLMAMLHLHGYWSGLLTMSRDRNSKFLLFLNLCSVTKSGGTMEQRHEKRSYLQAVAAPTHKGSEPWAPLAEAGRAILGPSWGDTGPEAAAGLRPGPGQTMQEPQQPPKW